MMRTILALLALAGAAWAQDRSTESTVNRLKDRLGLTEEQTAKVREIYAQDAEERRKLDEGRSAKMAEILDENQKKQYEEMRQRQGGRAAGGGLGGGGALNLQNRGLGALSVDDLKRELTLSDPQVEKIRPIVDEFNADQEKRMAEFRDKAAQGGLAGLNWQEELQKFQERLGAVTEKIKAHLTDEQKPKADALLERNTGWMRTLPALLGRFGNPGQATPSAPPKLSVEERIRRAVEAMKIEKEDERAAVSSLIEKVVRAQAALEEARKASQDKLVEASKNADLSEPAVDDRIKESMEQRRKLERELNALRKQLVEVVTVRQELELLVQGVLE